MGRAAQVRPRCRASSATTRPGGAETSGRLGVEAGAPLPAADRAVLPADVDAFAALPPAAPRSPGRLA